MSGAVLQQDLGVENLQTHAVIEGLVANLIAPSLTSSSKHPPNSPNNQFSPDGPSEISCSSSSDTRSDHECDSDRDPLVWSSATLRSLENEEPILRENEDRFSMFPIL